jgi:N6-adenosine-specific RNA methylase IME4
MGDARKACHDHARTKRHHEDATWIAREEIKSATRQSIPGPVDVDAARPVGAAGTGRGLGQEEERRMNECDRLHCGDTIGRCESCPSAGYRTIVVDPPWSYPRGFPRGKKPTSGHSHKRAIAETPLPYHGMTMDEIMALPVVSFAATDCRLFMWTTNRYLRPAFDVLVAWGFRYSQTLVWHKTGAPSPFAGGAKVLAPVHAEFILVGARGRPPLLQRFKSSVLSVPVNSANLAHSQKPDVFLDLIEHASPGPYLEMFARRARFGWDYWGDQSLGTAEVGKAA